MIEDVTVVPEPPGFCVVTVVGAGVVGSGVVTPGRVSVTVPVTVTVGVLVGIGVDLPSQSAGRL